MHILQGMRRAKAHCHPTGAPTRTRKGFLQDACLHEECTKVGPKVETTRRRQMGIVKISKCVGTRHIWHAPFVVTEEVENLEVMHTAVVVGKLTDLFVLVIVELAHITVCRVHEAVVRAV